MRRRPRPGITRAVDVPALIDSIDGRTQADADRLLAGLLAHFWPGGLDDHHRPAAVEWVRRWGHVPALPGPVDCSPN